MKRKFPTGIDIQYDQNFNMTDKEDLSKKKCPQEENITSDAAAKVVAVALNRKNIKAKENEQDPIPSDGEYVIHILSHCKIRLCIHWKIMNV